MKIGTRFLYVHIISCLELEKIFGASKKKILVLLNIYIAV